MQNINTPRNILFSTKHSALLFAAILFLSHVAYGQELSLASVVGAPRFETYSLSKFSDNNKQRKMCITTKSGLISMGGGVTLMAIGVGIYFGNNQEDNTDKTGASIVIGGIVVFCAGSALTIGGATHDIINLHKQRWGIIAPKRNQLGLAYSF